jgi:hypothetical protein
MLPLKQALVLQCTQRTPRPIDALCEREPFIPCMSWHICTVPQQAIN